MVISDFHSTVDIELCNGCEVCIAICPVSAISMEEERAVVNVARCIGCGLCVLECPEEATSLAPRKQEV
jgi:heterodisulfide reductase subunit A-like polyferredoxin